MEGRDGKTKAGCGEHGWKNCDGTKTQLFSINHGYRWGGLNKKQLVMNWGFITMAYVATTTVADD